MAIAKSRSKRKITGKKYKPFRGKKLRELGRNSALTHIENRRVKVKRTRGGSKKLSLLSDQYIIASDSQGNSKKLQVTGVVDNPANVNYARRNIITKGAIVKTDEGNIRVTSRPGQEGILQGKFVE